MTGKNGKERINAVPLAAGVFLFLVAVAPLHGANPEHSGPALGFGLGHVGLLDDVDEPAMANAEYRFGAWRDSRFVPVAGIAAVENGASFVYADLRYEYWLDDHWLLVPSAGVGRFRGNDSMDLGHLVEFRTGVEVAYRFRSGYRVGIAVHHFSNGGISERNPGVEALSLTLHVPLSD